MGTYVKNTGYIYVIEIKKGKIYLNIKPNAHTYAEAVI